MPVHSFLRLWWDSVRSRQRWEIICVKRIAVVWPFTITILCKIRSISNPQTVYSFHSLDTHNHWDPKHFHKIISSRHRYMSTFHRSCVICISAPLFPSLPFTFSLPIEFLRIFQFFFSHSRIELSIDIIIVIVATTNFIHSRCQSIHTESYYSNFVFFLLFFIVTLADELYVVLVHFADKATTVITNTHTDTRAHPFCNH